MFKEFTKEECINCIKENVAEDILKELANNIGYNIGKETITFSSTFKSAQKNFSVFVYDTTGDTINPKKGESAGNIKNFRCLVIGNDNAVFSQVFTSYIYDLIDNLKNYKSEKKWAEFNWQQTIKMSPIINMTTQFNDCNAAEFNFTVVFDRAAN